MSSSVGVARCRSFSAHALCHFSISLSATRGKALVGRSRGKGSPVSGFLMLKVRTAVWMKGTCSSGPSNISMDCQRTKPFFVRAGMEGGAKSLVVGCSVCWHPIDA
jgi:hypothetical protein